jgi:hypothetical protein
MLCVGRPDISVLTGIVGMSDIACMDVQALIDKAGGEPEFQALCDVARTTVLDWKRTGQIPASRLPHISATLGVPLDDVIKLASPPPRRKRASVARAVQPQTGEAA